MGDLGKKQQIAKKIIGSKKKTKQASDKSAVEFNQVSSEELKKRRIDSYPYLI